MKMGCLLHCDTGSLRKHNSSVPCSVLLTNNYAQKLAIGASRPAPTQHTAKNSIYKFSSGFPFKPFLRSLAKKSPQNSPNLRQDCCFIHPPLIFATQSLIKSLQHIKLCINLLSQNLWTLCIFQSRESSSIDSESYFVGVVNKHLNS